MIEVFLYDGYFLAFSVGFGVIHIYTWVRLMLALVSTKYAAELASLECLVLGIPNICLRHICNFISVLIPGKNYTE